MSKYGGESCSWDLDAWEEWFPYQLTGVGKGAIKPRLPDSTQLQPVCTMQYWACLHCELSMLIPDSRYPPNWHRGKSGINIEILGLQPWSPQLNPWCHITDIVWYLPLTWNSISMLQGFLAMQQEFVCSYMAEVALLTYRYRNMEYYSTNFVLCWHFVC